MAKARLSGVCAQNADLPSPVVEVLAPQVPEAGSVAVRNLDGRVADDGAARVQQPIAQLVVLIADHRLVEREAQPGLATTDAHEDGVHYLALCHVVVARPA